LYRTLPCWPTCKQKKPRCTVRVQHVELHVGVSLPLHNTALLPHKRTENKICSDGAACKAAHGYKATCTECCAAGPQWVAQWRNWRCPGRCWLSAWLHTVHQRPQALSCTQEHIICSADLTKKLQVPAQTALEKEDLPCMYLAHHEPGSVYIIILSVIICSFHKFF